MPGRMGASPFPWIQRHDLRINHIFVTLEFKLCTNIMNYRDMPKEEAGGRPDG